MTRLIRGASYNSVKLKGSWGYCPTVLSQCFIWWHWMRLSVCLSAGGSPSRVQHVMQRALLGLNHLYSQLSQREVRHSGVWVESDLRGGCHWISATKLEERTGFPHQLPRSGFRHQREITASTHLYRGMPRCSSQANVCGLYIRE